MGAIRLTSFGGVLPRTAERLIPDNAAQIAVNCRLSSGEMIPFNTGEKVYSSFKIGPFQTIHRIEDGAASAWLAWQNDVDVVRAILFGTARWCFTGDGEPRITAMADAVFGGGDMYPSKAYVLGTPKPVTAPTVTPTGGVGATVTRFYAYTFYSKWGDVEFEGAVSPVSASATAKVDSTWSITAMNATPPNSGTVTGVFASGETEFTDTAPHWLRVGEQVVISGATLTVTAVGTNLKFKVAGDYSAATTWARKADFAGTLYKRLYRSAGTAGQFQLVAEAITGTTYIDTLTDATILGDELISGTWEMPPVGLKGIFSLPSGALAGFIDNKLCVSEPNQPHAWPPEYQMQADYPIVAAGSFGSGIALATVSKPFLIQGVEPGQMSGQSWEEVLPCVSKRSAVSLGDALIYASESGFIRMSGAGIELWSLPYFTDKEFPNYTPETMVSAMVGRRLYVKYTVAGVNKILIFNLLGDDQYLTEAHFSADDIHADSTDNQLYYSKDSDIFAFDPADGYSLSQDWQSKEIVLPAPQNLGAAKVNFVQAIDPLQSAAINAKIAAVNAANAALIALGTTHGEWNAATINTLPYNDSDLQSPPDNPPANEVIFSLYTNGALRASRTVKDNNVFRLPSGYKADTVSFRVQSQCRIKSVELGETPLALRQS